MPHDRLPSNAMAITEQSMDFLVSAFEERTLPKDAWTHAAHVTVAAHYIFLFGEEQALRVMRERVRAFNEAVGTVNSTTGGYHETLTRMWIAVLARLHTMDAPASRIAWVQRAVALYGTRRDLHVGLYHFDVVKSSKARMSWVPPDHWPSEGIIG